MYCHKVCILRSRTMDSTIFDTAEFPPTSHAHIHQYQNHQRSAPEATARRDSLAVHARRPRAFSCVSLCFSRNTAKNKSEVICVLCCELIVVFSDGTIFQLDSDLVTTKTRYKVLLTKIDVCLQQFVPVFCGC